MVGPSFTELASLVFTYTLDFLPITGITAAHCRQGRATAAVYFHATYSPGMASFLFALLPRSWYPGEQNCGQRLRGCRLFSRVLSVEVRQDNHATLGTTTVFCSSRPTDATATATATATAAADRNTLTMTAAAAAHARWPTKRGRCGKRKKRRT